MTATLSTSKPKLDQLLRRVERVVFSTPVCDMHTHLYDPAFDRLFLWGIDDLLVYHYLVAEVFRQSDVPFDKFQSMTRTEQADLIWNELFVKGSPVSESCRGVLTTLNRLGLDVWKRDLGSLRRWFARQSPEAHMNRVLELAGVGKVYMTNSPFDEQERPLWMKGFRRDERFVAALRLDSLLLDWEGAGPLLSQWGYKVTRELSRRTVDQVKRFLGDWTRRLEAAYLMVSLPPDWSYPGGSESAQLMEKAVLPFCMDAGLPLALMLGVKRAVNPAMGLAGDGVGRSDLTALQNLCAGHSGNRFLTTVLSMENQHELCVLARKFRNLHIFGCWWFTNIPHAIEAITRMRLELVGLSVTAQHSDSRVLEQLIYKWDHFRAILARVLTDKYADLIRAGWEPAIQDMQRDVQDLLGGAFQRFCRRA